MKSGLKNGVFRGCESPILGKLKGEFFHPIKIVSLVNAVRISFLGGIYFVSIRCRVKFRDDNVE